MYNCPFTQIQCTCRIRFVGCTSKRSFPSPLPTLILAHALAVTWPNYRRRERLLCKYNNHYLCLEFLFARCQELWIPLNKQQIHPQQEYQSALIHVAKQSQIGIPVRASWVVFGASEIRTMFLSQQNIALTLMFAMAGRKKVNVYLHLLISLGNVNQ